MIKGILFDMDGVLIDSEPTILRAATKLFKPYGIDVKPSDFIPFIGAGDKRYIIGVAEKYGLNLNFEIERKKLYKYYEQEVSLQEAMPGVLRFINNTKKVGLKIALASSATYEKILMNLNAMGLQKNSFDALISGENVSKTKPNPEIYLSAAKLLNLPTKECLVIEDAINGIQAGKAAGASVCALNTSFTDEEVQKAGCDLSIKDLSSFNNFSTNNEFQDELVKLGYKN